MSTLLSFVCTKCRTWKGVRRIVCPYSARCVGHSGAPYGHLRTCLYGRLFGHRSSSDAEQSLDDGLDDIINNIDSAVAAIDRRNFVVYPPGAFHMGNHHYMKDGVR